MMQRIVLCTAIVLAAFLPAACNLAAPTQGPMTWIDQPLNGMHFPLGTIILQAHASDANGISAIKFYVGESLLQTVSAGGGRLGEAMIEWTPSGPGTYLIGASGVDNQGNDGAKAVAQITVEGAAAETATPIPESASSLCTSESLAAPVLLSPADGTTVSLEPVLAWSYPDGTCHPHSYRIDVSEDASFTDISLGFGTLDYNETSRTWPLPAGKCYYWRALAYVPDVNGPASPAWSFCVAGSEGPSFTLTKNANCRAGPGTAYEADETLLQGETVPIQGRNTDNSWLWVRKPGSSRNCWVSVVTGQIMGDISTVQYASAPPPPKSTTQEPSAENPSGSVVVEPTYLLADLNPPSISNVSINPASVQRKGCGDETLTVSATVTDDVSGVAQVTYEIRGPGPQDQGDGYLLPPGGDYSQSYFSAVIGPIAGSAGSWSLTIRAVDMAQNISGAGPWTFTVVCIQ